MTYFDAETAGALQTAFEDAVTDWPAVSATTMFGCPSYRADGTLFAVLVTEGLALTTLPARDREDLEASFDTGPFQAGERTVSKWVQVPARDAADVDALLPYVRASYESALDAGDT